MNEIEYAKWKKLWAKLEDKRQDLDRSLNAAVLSRDEYNQAKILLSAIEKALAILEFKLKTLEG